jgi:Lon protease-like protein
VGSRRFRIDALLAAGAPYLRAQVQWLDEADGSVRPTQVAVTRRLCADVRELLEALTGQRRDPELPTDANQLSYCVAAQLPLDTADRQALLGAPTAADRLRLAVPVLRRELRLLQATSSIAVSASVLRMPTALN